MCKWYFYVKEPNNTVNVLVPGLWAGLSKGDCYLLGIHPTKVTSSCVDFIYTGSHSDQKNMFGNCENWMTVQ